VCYEASTQRVALARALAIATPAIALDEPTASIDREYVPRIEQIVRELRDQGTSVVIATHDAAQAHRLADCCFELTAGRISRTE
jgi:ABC-type sulfate/molybdate transport systems ATPase subunit